MVTIEDIIRKFIPSNPLDANAQSTLKRIIADSMAIFVKNYAKATPVVLVQNKEAQIKYDEKMKAKREKTYTCSVCKRTKTEAVAYNYVDLNYVEKDDEQTYTKFTVTEAARRLPISQDSARVLP